MSKENMEKKPAPKLFIILLILLTVGCSSGKHESIRKALEYDESIFGRFAFRTTWAEAFGPSSAETKADYVRKLKSVPLWGCPSDFKKAYEAHIAAWESGSLSAMLSTWQDVIDIAKLHGVDWGF